MKTPFTGGCAYGAFRYECTAEPLAMFQCHCSDAQPWDHMDPALPKFKKYQTEETNR